MKYKWAITDIYRRAVLKMGCPWDTACVGLIYSIYATARGRPAFSRHIEIKSKTRWGHRNHYFRPKFIKPHVGRGDRRLNNGRLQSVNLGQC